MTDLSLAAGCRQNTPARNVGKDTDDPAPPKRCRQSGGGFTLIELLVVVAILTILVVLLFPALGSLRDKANAGKCAGNLRAIGSAIHLNAGDNNGRWVIMDSLYGSWDKTMRDRNYMESDKASFCPGFAPKNYSLYQTYGATWHGFAMAPDDQNIITAFPETGSRTYYDIKLIAITHPSKYLLMSDSYTTRFKTQYHIVQGNTGMDEIHLRHNSRANALFADGHVEAADVKKLREIGWRMAFDKNGMLTNF